MSTYEINGQALVCSIDGEETGRFELDAADDDTGSYIKVEATDEDGATAVNVLSIAEAENLVAELMTQIALAKLRDAQR